jgi:hypothetical protein
VLTGFFKRRSSERMRFFRLVLFFSVSNKAGAFSNVACGNRLRFAPRLGGLPLGVGIVWAGACSYVYAINNGTHELDKSHKRINAARRTKHNA